MITCLVGLESILTTLLIAHVHHPYTKEIKRDPFRSFHQLQPPGRTLKTCSAHRHTSHDYYIQYCISSQDEAQQVLGENYVSINCEGYRKGGSLDPS